MKEPPRVHNKHANTAPPDAVYIGRGSPWGNPYSHLPISTARYTTTSRERSIEMFRVHILPTLDLAPLKGKHLVCWCAPLPCHGDLILEAVKQKYAAVQVTNQEEKREIFFKDGLRALIQKKED